jgi:flagellar hook assembly protein FlgD
MLRNILDYFGNAPGDTAVGVGGPVVDKGYTNALYSNYPNPFNPKTYIRFSIKEDGPVAVKVFNINGQLVRTLHDDNLSAGIYEMVWDGSGNDGTTVANGVYFYTVEANGFQATKKMTVLK